MALFLSQSKTPGTVGNLALAPVRQARGLRERDGGTSLQIVDVTGDLVAAEDLAAVLAPCRESAGVHATASGAKRDLAWHKSRFARACWEMAQARGCSLRDAVALVAVQEDSRWRMVKPQSRNYGNVRRWIGQLGKDRKGVPVWSGYGKLVKGHGGGRKSSLDGEFLERFFRVWLREEQPGVKTVLDALAVTYRRMGMGDRVPSYDALAAYVREKVPADVLAKYRSKRGDWADEHLGFVRRYVNCEVGDWIFGDHRIMDVWIKVKNDQDEWVPVRPYFTAWADARSGFVTAARIYAEENPSHRTIMDTFALHLARTGGRLPKGVYTDNGKDYLKQGFGTPVRLSRKRGQEVLVDKDKQPYDYCVLDALGVDRKLAAAYNGKEKPNERWHRDHATGWERMQYGWCGNNPESRPAEGYNVDRLMTIEQAEASFNEWLEEIGQQHVREDGRTRAQMWAEADLGHLVQLTPTDLAYRMLLPDATARLVGRVGFGPGVRYSNWEYGHAALAKYWGQPVMVKTWWRAPTVRRQIDSKRLGKVWVEVPCGIFVFTLDDVLLALCPAVPQVGMFAEGEDLELLGHIKHMANAIGMQATDGFEELTGRRMIERDPRRVLAGIGSGEGDRPQVTAGIVEVSPFEGERRTRRLKGEERRTSNIELSTPNGGELSEEEWDDLDDGPAQEAPVSELEQLLLQKQNQGDEEW